MKYARLARSGGTPQDLWRPTYDAGRLGAGAALDGLADVCEAGAPVLGSGSQQARSASSAGRGSAVSPASELSGNKQSVDEHSRSLAGQGVKTVLDPNNGFRIGSYSLALVE